MNRAIAAALALCSTTALAASVGSGSRRKPTPQASSKNSLPTSIAARLRQMGCSGDDFHLVMCARPKLSAYCQNARTNAQSCGAPDVAAKAQACLQATGTDAPIGQALASYDAAYGAYQKLPARCRNLGFTSSTGGSCDELAGRVGGFSCKSTAPNVKANTQRLIATARNELDACRGHERLKRSAASKEAASRGLTAVGGAERACANGKVISRSACDTLCPQFEAYKNNTAAACAGEGKKSRGCEAWMKKLVPVQRKAAACGCSGGRQH